MARRAKSKRATANPAQENFALACDWLRTMLLFSPLYFRATIKRDAGNLCPPDGWAVVTRNGHIHAHPTRRAEPQEWLYVLAHCLLHLALGHFQEQAKPREWNAACDCMVARFLAEMKLGRPPESMRVPLDFPFSNEEQLYRHFYEHGIPPHLEIFNTAPGGDMIFGPPLMGLRNQPFDWDECFASGIAWAVTDVLDTAAGVLPEAGARKHEARTRAQEAKAWFINHFPLLGALAASFKIVEDPLVCQRLAITVAAVDAQSGEIFISPGAGLSSEELRFVMAHELLHVGLRHDARRQGRDPYLWNVACDYVINGWLVEMGVGELPHLGALYDPELKGLSAESIYDLMVTDMRRFRKLATLRGIELCDMLERGTPDWWTIGDGLALDDFYRRCLSQGLSYCEYSGRGFLPAGLIEEINALSQPPIPWDVQLARWFDEHFPPLEKRRTYARLSRRQSATPDIPRPAWVVPEDERRARTFGVLLDTSGSMERRLLARALGTIASYATARDVAAVRVVFCDAAVYDQGYMPPEDIAGRVKVRGRGGTVLQPGVNMLENAKDFPKDGPLLLITDGYCDRLTIRREHAFVVPYGNRLPFVPRGPVFYVRE
jgi:predicted metal-dependent peptidase